ncbi:MAG: Txe/YoeB family addiction module toxin [Alkaliphilus sp.]|nr:Txe/YoeB family addiction module toxin [bacterium AH-315-E09]PHS36587.1 MAG: Txe/YoeB family addiction module toxin [Alkaliphilus sp.]
MGYKLKITKLAIKDAKKLEQNGLDKKAIKLLKIISINPYQSPPPLEKLKGFSNIYSRRINIQHRLLYEIHEKDEIIKVLRMWTHYE